MDNSTVCVFLVTQSCPTLYNPMECSPPGSSIHGTLQARIHSGLPFPTLGDPPRPGIEPTSPALAGEFFTTVPSVQFSRSVMSNSLRPRELQHTRLPRPSSFSRICSLMSIELVMPPSHLILCHSLLLLP